MKKTRAARPILKARVGIWLKREALMWVFGLLCSGAVGQDVDERWVDSMKTHLDPERIDTAQLMLNSWLGNYLSNARRHEPYLQRAAELAEQLRDHPSEEVRKKAARAEARVWNIRGVVHWEDQRFADAINAYQRCREVALQVQDTGYCILAGNNIGLLLKSMDQPAKAMLEFKEALRLAQFSDDSDMRSILLGRIGDAYMQLGDTARGDSLLIEAIRASVDPHASVPQRFMLAERRIQQRRTPDARAHIRVIKELARSNSMDGPNWTGYAYLLDARIDTTEGRIDDALQQLDTCIMRTTDMNITSWCSRCLLMRARVLQSMKAYSKAEADLVRVLQLSSGRKLLIERSNAAQLLKSQYAREGRTLEELRMTELWKSFGDSLHAMDAEKALMVVDFETASREDSMSYSLQQNELATAHARQLLVEQNRRTWLIFGLLITMIAAAMFLYRARLMRSTNTAILDAQAKLLESERAREASEVRTRIARDVHDQLGSDLTKLVMLSTEAKEVARTDVNGLPTIANDIERIAGEANRSLGDIVWSIDPHHDSLAGLTERVRAHCERMLKWSKVEHTIDCVHEGPDRSLDPATKRDIYLMLREALNNAIKYAKAKHIHVHFHTSEARVEFEVKDDGVGLAAGNAKGYGLKNMQQRAERIGGELQQKSAPGSGTRIAFRSAIQPM